MEILKHLIYEYGYFGIFIALVGGIVGLPIPDEVLLVSIGYYSFLGKVNIYTALASAYFGSVIGITISYYLGAKLGLPFLLRYGSKIRLTEARINKAQHLFSKHGPWLLMIGYFIPGLRHLTGYLAGISKLPLRTFMIYAYTGALIWVALFVLLGFNLGTSWFYIKQSFETYKWAIYFTLSISLSLLALLYLFRAKKVSKR